jgi:RNA polymerase sigma factor (sigma-70 family)
MRLATTRMNKVIDGIRKALLRADEGRVSDALLLDRFITCRDDAAAAALVRRHGQMVWGVCRRILANRQDAEDAFQVTFLVLVRRATSIRPREMVGNWLYGVAHQTALKARAMVARRRTREKQMMDRPEPAAPDEEPLDDLQTVLDKELSLLPEHYRAAIVLCDLEGRSRKDAARHLKIAEGTLSSRLTRARHLLAQRLTKRGVALSAGALAAALPKCTASTSVPAAAVSSTIKVVSILAIERSATLGFIPAKIALLLDEVLKTMLIEKLKSVTAFMVIMCVLGMGGGLFAERLVAIGPGPREHGIPKRAEKPKKLALASQNPAEKAGEKSEAQKPPMLKTFAVPAGDAEAVANNLQLIYKTHAAKSPNFRIAAIGNNSIMVYAPPEHFVDIAKLMDYLHPQKLAGDTPLATKDTNAPGKIPVLSPDDAIKQAVLRQANRHVTVEFKVGAQITINDAGNNAEPNATVLAPKTAVKDGRIFEVFVIGNAADQLVHLGLANTTTPEASRYFVSKTVRVKGVIVRTSQPAGTYALVVTDLGQIEAVN